MRGQRIEVFVRNASVLPLAIFGPVEGRTGSERRQDIADWALAAYAANPQLARYPRAALAIRRIWVDTEEEIADGQFETMDGAEKAVV